MHNNKLRGDKLKNRGAKCNTQHRDLDKNVKSKGVIQQVEIRNIIRYEVKQNIERSQWLRC